MENGKTRAWTRGEEHREQSQEPRAWNQELRFSRPEISFQDEKTKTRLQIIPEFTAPRPFYVKRT